MRQIFVPAIGQYDNIGDIILRRPLLNALRERGRLHIYLGASPDGYPEGLALSDDDVVYSSFGSWYRALVRQGTDYAFKPGEIQLSAAGMKEHVAMLPGIALIRMRRGEVVRIGSGARRISRAWALPVRPSVWLSTVVAWRDASTAQLLGGMVVPDLGFFEGSREWSAVPRDSLVVSMRGDRPEPADAWVETVRTLANERGLSITVVTQVARDQTRTHFLAARLGANEVSWNGTNHAEQEAVLREHYRRAALVVSDRLHVLIAAATEGATPLALLTAASNKIDRHLDAAGFPTLSVDTSDVTVAAATERAKAALAGVGSVTTIVESARARIDTVLERVTHRLAKA